MRQLADTLFACPEDRSKLKSTPEERPANAQLETLTAEAWLQRLERLLAESGFPQSSQQVEHAVSRSGCSFCIVEPLRPVRDLPVNQPAEQQGVCCAADSRQQQMPVDEFVGSLEPVDESQGPRSAVLHAGGVIPPVLLAPGLPSEDPQDPKVGEPALQNWSTSCNPARALVYIRCPTWTGEAQNQMNLQFLIWVRSHWPRV